MKKIKINKEYEEAEEMTDDEIQDLLDRVC